MKIYLGCLEKEEDGKNEILNIDVKDTKELMSVLCQGAKAVLEKTNKEFSAEENAEIFKKALGSHLKSSRTVEKFAMFGLDICIGRLGEGFSGSAPDSCFYFWLGMHWLPLFSYVIKSKRYKPEDIATIPYLDCRFLPEIVFFSDFIPFASSVVDAFEKHPYIDGGDRIHLIKNKAFHRKS